MYFKQCCPTCQHQRSKHCIALSPSVLSCPVLSCPVLSCPVLSFVVCLSADVALSQDFHVLLQDPRPFGTPFRPQNSPEKSLCGSLFCVLSQEMRHINFFSGGPQWGILGGGQKVYVEKSLCAVSVPYKLREAQRIMDWATFLNSDGPRIDSQIRAYWTIRVNRLRVPELNPVYANRVSGH